MNRRPYFLHLLIVSFSLINSLGFSRDNVNPLIDSLRQQLQHATDSVRVDLLNAVAYNYYYLDHDSTGTYVAKAIELADSIRYLKGLSEAQRLMGIAFKAQNNVKEAVEWLYKGLETAESINYHQGIADNLNSIGILFSYVDDFERATSYFKRSVSEQIIAKNRLREGIIYSNIGDIYLKKGDTDSSYYYYERSSVILDSIGDERWIAMILSQYGGLLIKTSYLAKAEAYSLKALALSERNGQIFHSRKSYQNLAEIYLIQHHFDKALAYAEKALEEGEQIGFIPYLIETYEVLYKIHKAMDRPQQALSYHEKYAIYKDSLISDQINSETGLLPFLKELEQKELENQLLREENETREAENLARQDIIQKQTITVISFFVILTIVSIAAIILFRLRQKERDAFVKLIQSNKDLEDQKEELSATLQMVEHLNAQLQAQNNALNQSAIVSLTDLEGHIISVNDNFCRVSGYSRDELIGKNKRIVKSDEHPRQFFEELWETIKNGSNWRGEIKNRKKNGDSFWCDTALSPVLDDNGNPKQFFSLQFEITERKNSLNQLATKSQELEDLNRLKDRLLSIVSHDFRGPLNSLQGTLNLLLKGALTQDEFKLLTRDLVEKLDHTYNLLENLLNWARSQMQGMKVYAKTVDLKVIADDCVGLLSSIAEKKLVTINSNIHNSMNVFADNEMVKLILRNLLSNSIKFSNPRTEIALDAKTENNKVVVWVRDCGLGMSNENQEKLFKYENFSTYGTSNEKGMGIGLLLCKDFVERNGGRIWFESELEKGSTFYFSLPTKEATAIQNQS